ncbi:MAG: sugar ABC transporter permease [Anaerolineae bacterium]|nr:sugar ABC transporter permease [Anaerolineae bacterium]
MTSQPSAATQVERKGLGLFSGRRGLKRREAMLAYLFLAPAIIIIGLFGLFPLVFSAYQSTRAGLNNVVGRPDGLGQYIRAMDNLAYVFAFWMAVFFVVVAVQQLSELLRTAQAKEENPWRWLLPGVFSAAGLALLLWFVFTFMPGLLEIGEKLVGLTTEERNEMFSVFLREAWTTTGAASIFYYSVVALILSGAAYYFVQRNSPPTVRDSFYTGKLTTAVFMTLLAIALTWLTFGEIQAAYAEALEAGESLALWAQIVTISAGFVLLLLSWLLWRTAAHRDSNLQTGLRFLAAILLMVGGWVLITELPAAIAEGDEDWWTGLLITIYYVIGTLPLELGLGLVLATLLYQDIKAKGLFRMIFFLPYITPEVGAAAVFKVLFSGNPTGTMNTVLASFGFAPLGWLNEPGGVNQIIGSALNVNVPEWAAGPSLALVVAIVFGIWKYTGYNVVFFLAGLGNISREYYEAASMDGAGRWAQFRHITLPLLSPITYFLTIFGVIGTFKAFNTIFVLRSRAALGTMDTASLVIFDAFNRDTRIGYAAALGIVLLIVILGATALLDRVAKGRVFYG